VKAHSCPTFNELGDTIVSSRFARLLLSGAAVAAVAAGPAYGQEAPPPPPPVDPVTAPPVVPGLSTEPPPAPTDYVPATGVYSPLDGDELPARPLYGDLNPFYGDLNPFYGDINPFYGDINPFWGDINPFHGDLIAFWGDINPFWGDINPFYGDINPFYGDINPFNQNAPSLEKIGQYWQGFGNSWAGTESLWTNPLLGAALSLKMNTVIAEAQLTWGASIQAQTGKSFNEAFLNPLLARYGINPNNPSTMRALTASQRSQFFVDWYDSLMGFAGIDRPDHWMHAVNWTPAITQQQGSGADSIIGLLDATPMNDPDIANNVAWAGGGTATVNGHGVGVASLMVAAHDRQGVMGIAPNATVIAYNPFDSTNTASWTAIREGILSLASRNASVINMSLGVPGYTLHPDWRSIFFDPAVYNATWSRTFVLAAGNNGATQTTNVAWDFSHSPNLIIVGSVNVDGQISSFSNRPGNACLTDAAGVCREQLANRFMVAPGELILLPDGNGGFVRRSGTSFSAPLVSGAITLLHDRWPWLAYYPRETVDIMLLSARDLGAPGVDPVYGHGMLDVAASQAPLNFNNLMFFEMRNGVMTYRSATDVKARGVDTTWEAAGVYFHMFEPIGRTFRDFTVPVSSRLVGSVRTLLGREENFQRFIQNRFTDWLRPTGFTDTNTVQMTALPHLRISVTGSGPDAYLTSRPGNRPTTAFNVTDVGSGLGFTAGFGNGAMALNGQSGFGLTADHGRDGGVNPLLALASGGEFASAQVPLGRSTQLSVGMTRNEAVDYDRLDWREEADRAAYRGIDPLQADAMNIRLTHQASPNLLIAGAYARIREHNGLLGVQSSEAGDLGHGSTSETATVSATLRVTPRFSLAASGTLGRTRTAGNLEQGFLTQGEGVTTTAFALSATQQGVLGRRDAMRLTLSQPLHIENGQLAYRDVQVVDRTSGDLGLADQPFDINGDPRSVAAELLYATPLFRGQGEFGLFGRAELQVQGNTEVNQYSFGSRLSVRF
jgi:hypothetical protein